VSGTQHSRATGGDASANGVPDPAGGAAPGVKHRWSWIVFVALGSVFCLAMGLWQLSRYREASGTVQNLGYTFMWPFLAGFLWYAYLKYVRLEAEANAPEENDAPGEVDDDEPGHRTATVQSARGSRARGRAATEIPADLLPTRTRTADSRPRDEGLDAYNTYLAELARKDRAGESTHQEKPAS